MREFLIQTVDGLLRHDFTLALYEAIHYYEWLDGGKTYSALLEKDVKGADIKHCIPVGSLDFVFNHLRKYHTKQNFKPINIPPELFKEEYLKRTCFITTKQDLTLSKPMFVKSNTSYKTFTDVVTESTVLPDDEYLVSELISIDSEWRAFIFDARLVGLNNYAGDFTLLPDIPVLHKMIKDYKNCPQAYTLDVGVNADGTFIIEVHPFVSCGLYGFNNTGLLPMMFTQGYTYLLRN